MGASNCGSDLLYACSELLYEAESSGAFANTAINFENDATYAFVVPSSATAAGSGIVLTLSSSTLNTYPRTLNMIIDENHRSYGELFANHKRVAYNFCSLNNNAGATITVSKIVKAGKGVRVFRHRAANTLAPLMALTTSGGASDLSQTGDSLVLVCEGVACDASVVTSAAASGANTNLNCVAPQ